MVRSLALAAVVVLALLATAAAPAAAEPALVARFALGPGEQLTDVQLAGERTIWVVRAADGTHVVRSVRPGAAPEALAAFPGARSRFGGPGSPTTVDVVASATHLAALVRTEDVVCPKAVCAGSRERRLVAGPLTGDLRELERCSADVDARAAPALALDGSVLADTALCGAGGPPRVRDLATGEAPRSLGTRESGAPLVTRPLAVAGGRLAVATAEEVVLHDVADGRVLRAFPARARTVSLQADGTVAWATATGLAWASPAEPFAHAVAPAGPGALTGLGRGRVLLARPALTAQALVGGAADVLARGSSAGGTVTSVVTAADAQDAVAAWAAQRCEVVTVLRDDTALTDPAPARPEPAPTRCGAPAVLGVRLGQRGASELRVRLACARGCRGRLSLFARTGTVPAGAAPVRVRLPRGTASREVRVPVAPAFVRHVRRGARVTVRVRARLVVGRDLEHVVGTDVRVVRAARRS